MERDQASKFVNDLLRLMVSRNGSDLFLTADFPPAIKVDGKVTKVSPQPLTGETRALAETAQQLNEVNRRVRNLLAANVAARIEALGGPRRARRATYALARG